MKHDGPNAFEAWVHESWTDAVMRAAKDLAACRPHLMTALRSPHPNVRSAAVTALNEGNAADAHDEVVALIDDPDGWVRQEVAEYLQDFAEPSDVEMMLDRIARVPDLRFLLTDALCRLTGRKEGVLLNDASPTEVEDVLADWRTFFAQKRSVSRSG